MAKLFLFDHGFLRVFWRHEFRIAPGVWRSNQPGPWRIKGFATRGFKSILRLRGQSINVENYMIEKEACAEFGLNLHTVGFRGGKLTSQQQLIALLDEFKIIQKPFVIHCKSGIDRTGFAAFLYLLAETDTPPEIARRQLSFKYLHLKQSRHGILDHVADSYLAAHRATGIGIRQWLETVYDQEALSAEYKSGRVRR